jgi:hypothetical protein
MRRRRQGHYLYRGPRGHQEDPRPLDEKSQNKRA